MPADPAYWEARKELASGSSGFRARPCEYIPRAVEIGERRASALAKQVLRNVSERLIAAKRKAMKIPAETEP